MEAFLQAFDALPVGTFSGRAHGRTYVVCRSSFADGKAEKLVAEAVDGGDYISLNVYRLKAGAALRPCEMPEAKVVAFVCALTVL